MAGTSIPVALSSADVKKYKTDALVYHVSKLINENVEEKEFATILTTISTIIAFDYSDPATSVANFQAAVAAASDQKVYELRVWYTMHMNPY